MNECLREQNSADKRKKMLSPRGGWEGDEKKKNILASVLMQVRGLWLTEKFFISSHFSGTSSVLHFSECDFTLEWHCVGQPLSVRRQEQNVTSQRDSSSEAVSVMEGVGGKMWPQCTCKNKIFFFKNGLGRKDAKMNNPRRGISADHSGAYSSGNRYSSLPVRRPRSHIHSRHPNIPCMLSVQLHDDFIKPPNWQTVSASQLLSSRLHSPAFLVTKAQQEQIWLGNFTGAMELHEWC